MKPSIFIKDPIGSVLQKSESETIARNIMVILQRTGDVFRELTWDEYKQERLKDKNFYEAENGYFKDVITYCANAERAMCFSPVWRDAYVKELKRQIKNNEQTILYSREVIIKIFNDYSQYRNSEEMHNGEEPLEFEQWFNKNVK